VAASDKERLLAFHELPQVEGIDDNEGSATQRSMISSSSLVEQTFSMGMCGIQEGKVENPEKFALSLRLCQVAVLTKGQKAFSLPTLLHVLTGMSGRFLRKLPFHAHAFFVQRASVSVSAFLHALEAGVHKEAASRKQLK